MLLERTRVEPSTLFVPDHAVKNEGEPVLIGEGSKTLEGKYVSTRTWKFTNPENGRTQICCLIDPEMSDDAVEQAKGEAKENFLNETRGLPKLASWTPAQRKEIGRAIEEIRQWRARIKESTNNKLIY